MARKPLIGTLVENTLEHGTGAINVAACRIEARRDDPNARDYKSHNANRSTLGYDGGWKADPSLYKSPYEFGGRWPANVVLDEIAAVLLDEQSGIIVDRNSPDGVTRPADKERIAYSTFKGKDGAHPGFHGTQGGASRFFYTAKASRFEREIGMYGFPEKPCGTMEDDSYSWEGEITRGRKPRNAMRANNHPCVKPIDLMTWLIKMVAPPGAIILDPFMGSGTTGIAADRLGFDFIGIEISPEYAEIARKRIHGDCPLFADIA